MRHDSGLAASPPVRHILGVERGGEPSFFACPLWDRQVACEPQRGCTSAPEESPVGLRTQPPNEDFSSSAKPPAITSIDLGETP